MTAIARFSRAVALLLLAWQAVVAQTHLHARVLASPAVSVSAVASTAPQRQDSPFECPVCREVAHAGQYLSPGPVLFQPPAAVALWLAAAVLSPLALGQASHDWRSRAPPVPLLSA